MNAAYPGIYTSQAPFHNLSIDNILFARKGRTLAGLNHEGEARPLLVVCGHLPHGLTHAGEMGVHPSLDEWRNTTCFQAGCAEPAVSTYVLKKRFCRSGHPSESGFGSTVDARRFCPLHLKRGDAGLEDADTNYEVAEGPGPDEAVGWQQYENKAKTMPAINITKLGGVK